MNDSLSISSTDFIEQFEQLKPYQQRKIMAVLELMVAERGDVYFLVCLKGDIAYQGYCIDTALNFYNKGMATVIRHYEAHQTKLESAFLCVNPDNTVFNFGLGGGVE